MLTAARHHAGSLNTGARHCQDSCMTVQVRWLDDTAYVHVVVDHITEAAGQPGSWAVSLPKQRGSFTTAQCSGPPGACALASARPCAMDAGERLQRPPASAFGLHERGNPDSAWSAKLASKAHRRLLKEAQVVHLACRSLWVGRSASSINHLFVPSQDHCPEARQVAMHRVET